MKDESIGHNQGRLRYPSWALRSSEGLLIRDAVAEVSLILEREMGAFGRRRKLIV